jgi:ABC-type polysaccharide/polyol phosphate export permease
MPKKRFHLGFGKAPSLEISWEGGWFRVVNNIAVKYDGAVVGSFPSRFDLEKGQEIQLPDGGLLNIKLVSSRFEIFYNQQSVQEITDVIWHRNFSFVFGVSLFLYGIWDFVQVRMLWEAIIHCGIGLGYIACGLMAQKNYSWSSWGFVLLSMVYIAIFRVIEPIKIGESPHVVGILALFIIGLSIFIAIFAKYFRTAKT